MNFDIYEQNILNKFVENLLLHYNIFLLNYVQGFEADETNELISYVDLLEIILGDEKEDIKLAAIHL